MGADRADPHHVAVGLGIGDALGAGHAAGAADVLDHDLLAEDLTHALGEHAADGVLRPARRERDHHGDRARRIILRGCGCQQRHYGRERGDQNPEHRVLAVGAFDHLLYRACRAGQAVIAGDMVAAYDGDTVTKGCP